MASGSARGRPGWERSLQERPGRRSRSGGRSRSRSGEREGEQRALREELPAGDVDCEDGGEAAKSPNKPRGGPGGAAEGRGESSANGAVAARRAAGKRGRKGKAEVLLLELSQPPEPIRREKGLGSSEERDGLESPGGGRPKRRAAKVALLYLQELAEELMPACQPPAPARGVPEPEHVRRKRRGRRRKGEDTDSDDPAQDADFVPSQEVLQADEEEEGSDTLCSEASEAELEAPRGHGRRTAAAGRSKPQCRGLAPNGFHNSIMAPVEKSSSLTCSLREQKHSQWEFPDWIPVAHRWTCLSDSEAAPYLPAEDKSALFSIQREGIKDDGALYRLNRFSSLQPHPERLDMSFFVGGPVWAMEWCPTPEGSAAPQYMAVSCHRSMEETHSVAGLHSGPALLQIWDLGVLHTEQGSPSKARLAYAIAADYGCVWDMKFCPSGAWEPPTAARTPPQMSRLGLLAAAFSDGRVVVYALPHPGALLHAKTTQVKDGSLHKHLICKVQCIATLQVGSIQAGNASECGQCFSLSWMPCKPHHHLAAGFYDGTVAVWNLLTKSLLQCVPQPDASLKLYPFQCFLAHDHAVRSIEWCKADSNFLVTVGSDRKIKFWDLRRLYEPINSIKRFLSTEVAWLLPYNGITVAQDNCYAPYGLCGIHYIDAGYLGFKAYFVAPRKGTVWSISGSDWLNTVAAGDITGELVAAVLPDLAVNPLNIKRSSDRRFPVYKADLLPHSPEGPERAEQALPRTHCYSEMVARSYIRFQDTDLVGGDRGQPECGWAVGTGPGGAAGALGQPLGSGRAGITVHVMLLPRARSPPWCHRFPAQLPELAEPGAHAPDAHAGAEGRAESGPPADGGSPQGAFQPQPGLAGLAGVRRAGGHCAGTLPGRAGLQCGPPAAPRVPGPLQRPLWGHTQQPRPRRALLTASRVGCQSLRLLPCAHPGQGLGLGPAVLAWGYWPSQCCFPSGCLLQEGQLPAIPWGALDVCPHARGLEGSVCAVGSELGRVVGPVLVLGLSCGVTLQKHPWAPPWSCACARLHPRCAPEGGRGAGSCGVAHIELVFSCAE